MKGLRTYSNHRFGELFHPLFEPLRGHVWLTSPECFQFPAEWVDASEYDEATERHTAGPIQEFEAEVTRIADVKPLTRTTFGYSASTPIFPKFAPAVIEDWCFIFAVRGPVPNPRQWFENFYASKTRGAYLSEHVDVVFRNVDAAFWECFTGRADLLSLLAQHFEASQIAAEPVELAKTDYL